MTGKVVNLRTARKRRDRAAEEARAAENRTRHGRTKAERARDADRTARTDRHLDGHRLDEE